ncbi:MAG: YczE/YyaS/YitT family protein, partial [Bacteroidota bacterium]
MPVERKLSTRATARSWQRWLQLIVGLAIFGIAVALMIRSELGLGPWDAFHVGLNRLTGITVGSASIAAGVVIVVATLFIGVRPGPGTIANMILIGVFIDIFLPLTPPASSTWLAFVYFGLGVIGCGFATGLYIAAGLGKGPRDGLMIGVSHRTGWRVGRVRTGIE